MADVKERILGFKKTINTEVEIRRIESGWYHELTWLFDECPIFTVRKTILNYWLDRSIKVHDRQACWIEARIYDLKKEEGEIKSGFWKELLNWYIFNADDKLANRALDFAVGITKIDNFGDTQGFIYRSDILKIIAGRLDRSPEIYWHTETPVLKSFLQSFLIRSYQPDSIIYDFIMVDIKRVVRCAVKIEDWGFMPLVEQVLYKLFNQKRPKKYDFRQEVEMLENIAFLKEAVRLFRKKIEEVKDI